MAASDNAVQLALLGGFLLSHHGRPVALSSGAQRLLALLALQNGAHRAAAATQLWPDSPPSRAAANLRSALWRGRRVGAQPLIDAAGPRLRLSPAARVDVLEIREQATRGLGEPIPPRGEFDTLLNGLSRDLLPGWTEDWLLLERERWDQIRLHTLEELAQHLLLAGNHLLALQTALAAIAIEPIRETAHRTVMEIHIAEGNAASALKHYQRYRTVLHRELGVTPSPLMAELARTLLGD
ncbi:AfsR/SARP family transcriptional regulator [Amycolatopsis acidicola]|nr:BTAD domain-containing putative transcriptional regulator [Amycolatopsis acidicola]